VVLSLACRIVFVASATAGLLLSASPSGAIVGGVERNDGLNHRSLMVLSSRGGVCSGIVLAQDVVLTAGHCVSGAPEHRLHYRDEDGSPVLVVPREKVVHPGFDAKAIGARRRSIDLALVLLPEPLPARFVPALLTAKRPARDMLVTVGGYGVSREGEARTTGTYRSADLQTIEPYGPSSILLWAEGRGSAGACQGDSGGPLLLGQAVVAVTAWAGGESGRACGGLTQGILVGPQRNWIDRITSDWKRTVRWE
jgi:hypothetical protein